ncbi:MAG: inositol monophosphatase family protein [bacterium]
MQKKNELKKEKFYLSSTTKTQVIYPSKKFFHIWRNGPRNKESIPLLAQDIHTLGNTFLKFTRQPHKLQTFTKSHPQDLVTEIDQGIEALWRHWITTFLPNDQIIGEEQKNSTLKENKGTWYIDPIDGTSNFIKKNTFYAIQIAYIKNNEPLIAYIGSPIIKSDERLMYKGKIRKTLQTKLKIPTSIKKKSDYTTLYESIHKKNHKNNLIIGTEYLAHRKKQSQLYKQLLKNHHATPLCIKVISLNILCLSFNQSHCFYKPKAKLWDIIPPAAYIYLQNKTKWDISIVTHKTPIKPLSQANHTYLSPFQTDKQTITLFNNAKKNNYRIDLFIITLKNDLSLKKNILNMFLDD